MRPIYWRAQLLAITLIAAALTAALPTRSTAPSPLDGTSETAHSAVKGTPHPIADGRAAAVPARAARRPQPPVAEPARVSGARPRRERAPAPRDVAGRRSVPSGAAAWTAPRLPARSLSVSPSVPDIWLITHQGLMAAVSGTSFAPAGPVTAREALTALSKLFDPATRPARPAGGALRWAVTTHVVRHPRSFSGGDPLTQAHLIAWAVRALGLAGARAPTPRHTGAVTLYADEVAIARSHHLVAGGTRAPSSLTAPATRGDLAAILLRCERALALRRAGAPQWFAWDLRLGPAGATELLAGSVRAAAVGLPATGVIRGGTLRSSDGMLKETWIVSQGLEGVGHIVSLSGHRRRRVTFAWQTDPVLPAGAIWEYPPAGGVNPTVYLGAGTVRVEGLPAPVRIRSARAGEAVSTCLRACGPRSATLTYRGPSFAFVPILEMERFLLARR